MKTQTSREGQLIKNTIFYAISNFGSKILSFIIVPLYTYYLTTSEFGTYDTIVAVLNLIAPMCCLAIHEGLLRWLLKSTELKEEIICTGMSLYVGFIIITDLFFVLLFHFYKWEYAVLFIILLTVSTLYTTMQFVARGVRKNKAFAVSGVLYTFTMLVLNVCFVVFLDLGIKGMLLSMVVANVCVLVYLFLCLRKCFLFRCFSFNKTLANAMLRYSVMLVPNNVSWWIMNASDRIMLNAISGPSVTGIYALACKFPSIVTIIHTLFYQAWQEQAVLEYDSDSRDDYYTKVFNTYMKLACCMVLVLLPFTKLIIVSFMDSSYVSAYKYLGILYLASLFSSFSGFYGTGYISAKDTKNAMKTTVIGAIINILINLLFMKILGVWAACISTFVAYMVVWIIRVVQTKKYFTITVKWKIFILIMIMNVVFAILVIYTNNFQTIVMFVLAVLISVLLNRKTIIVFIKRTMHKFFFNSKKI